MFSNRFLLGSTLLLLTTFGVAQPGDPDVSPVLFTINESPVSLEEFRYVFNKNNRDSVLSKEDIDTYLDLFIDFKLKVTEARQLGLDTTSTYLMELAGYEEQIIKPYLTEASVIDDLVREAYDRKTEEIDASHILVRLPDQSSSTDTLAAWQRIELVRDLLMQGHDFDSLAKVYSEEPLVQRTGGHLGYFTSLQMVYPFENAAYQTPVGGISEIVRTQYGYHVIRVNEKRPSSGTVSISHIMKMVPNGSSQEDIAIADSAINSIHLRLKQGASWTELCRTYSDDSNTKGKDGTLKRFGVGEMIPSIAEAAFQLKEPGDISEPIRSPYGWHVIRLNEKVPLQSLEELKRDLVAQVRRDGRATTNRDVVLNRLKEENGFRQVSEPGDYVSDAPIDSLRTEFGDEVLFQLGSESVLLEDFLDYSAANRLTVSEWKEGFLDFQGDNILEYERKNLENKNPELRMLMREYREGLLLFDVMDKKVWSAAVEDSIGLMNFYSSHLDDYANGGAASIVVLDLSDTSGFYDAEQLVIDIISDFMVSNDSLVQLIQDVMPGIPNVAFAGWIAEGELRYVDTVMGNTGIYLQVESESGVFRIVVVRDNEPESLDYLSLRRGRVISDYQDQLEREWVQQLRNTYTIRVNKKVLKQIYAEHGV